MDKGLKKLLNFSVFSLLLMLLGSCEKFEGDQTVPSYLHIDTFYLINNPLIEEGALTHKITDVWAYADDQLIGMFELPAQIPVLKNGIGKLRLVAGIKYNGFTGTRGPYFFYQPKIIEDFNFMIDSTQTINPTVSYYSTSVFTWMEDFEDGSSSLNPTNRSDTSLQLIQYSQTDPKYGNVSSVAYLDDTRSVLEIRTFADDPDEGFDLPSGGTPVFLEMDYNITDYLIVGIYIFEYGTGTTQHPVLVLNPTDGIWNKIYINLTPAVSAFPNAVYFNLFLRADKQTTEDFAVFKLDNLKLIHSP